MIDGEGLVIMSLHEIVFTQPIRALGSFSVYTTLNMLCLFLLHLIQWIYVYKHVVLCLYAIDHIDAIDHCVHLYIYITIHTLNYTICIPSIYNILYACTYTLCYMYIDYQGWRMVLQKIWVSQNFSQISRVSQSRFFSRFEVLESRFFSQCSEISNFSVSQFKKWETLGLAEKKR